MFLDAEGCVSSMYKNPALPSHLESGHQSPSFWGLARPRGVPLGTASKPKE